MSDNQTEIRFGAETSGLKEGTAEATATVEKTTASMMTAFKEMAASVGESMAKVSSHIKHEIKESGEQIEHFNKKVASIQGAFKMIAEAAMIGFIGEQIFELGEKTATYAHEMELASQKTGMSTDALQGFAGVAKTSGASVDNFLIGMRKLSMAMTGAQEGQEKYIDELAKVGIKTEDLKSMKLEDAIYKIADSYKEHNDGAGKVANAQALMGRGGMNLIPMFDKGSEAIREMVKELSEMGVIMSEEDIVKAAALKHELELTELGMEALKRQVGMALVPVLKNLTGSFIESAKHGGFVTQMANAAAIALKILATAVVAVMTEFQLFGKLIAVVGAEIAALAHGEFSQMGAIWKAYAQDRQETMTGNEALIKSFWKVAEAAKGGHHGEGGHKTDMPTTPPKPDKDASMIPAFREELEQKKTLEGEFFKDSRQTDVEYWEGKLKLVQTKSKDWYAIEREIFILKKQLAQEDLAAELTNLKAQEQDTEKSWQYRLAAADQAIKRLGETYGKDSKEYAAALKDKEHLERQFHLEMAKLAELRVAHERDLKLLSTEMEQDRTNYLLKLGAITDAEAIQQAKQTEDKIYQIKRQAAVQAANIPGLKPEDKLKANQAIETIEAEHGRKMVQLNHAASLEATKNYKTMFDSITHSMTTSIQGMIKGTMTFRDAMKNLTFAVLDTFIEMCVQTVAKWAWAQMVKLAMHETTTASISTTEAAANTASLAETISVNVAEAMSYAALAAVQAMSSVAAIPYIGWAMAPGIGAEQYATGMGFAAMASASGGFDIPAGINPVTQLHQQEMVLPAHLANPLREALSGGSLSGKNSGSSITINTMDARGVKQFLGDNASALVKTLSKQKRNFVGVR